MIKQSTLVTFMAAAGIALLGAQAAHADIVKIDGSSTVYPITEAVAEEFQKAKKNNIKVTVGICLLYTSPIPRDRPRSRMPAST